MAGLLDTRADWQRKQEEKRAKEKEQAEQKRAEELKAEEQRRKEQEARDREQAMPSGNATPGGAPPPGGNVPRTQTAQPSSADATEAAEAETVMLFEDHEERLIKRLYEFIDRPRLAKRFVNIYRLLRVRAHDEEEKDSFAATPSSEEYRAALVLLAINVGHPRVAAALLTSIATAPDGLTLMEILEGLQQGTSAVSTDSRQREEVGAVAGKLSPLLPEVPAKIDPYRKWAPRVGSFSFDWHRTATPPPQRRRPGRAGAQPTSSNSATSPGPVTR